MRTGLLGSSLLGAAQGPPRRSRSCAPRRARRRRSGRPRRSVCSCSQSTTSELICTESTVRAPRGARLAYSPAVSTSTIPRGLNSTSGIVKSTASSLALKSTMKMGVLDLLAAAITLPDSPSVEEEPHGAASPNPSPPAASACRRGAATRCRGCVAPPRGVRDARRRSGLRTERRMLASQPGKGRGDSMRGWSTLSQSIHVSSLSCAYPVVVAALRASESSPCYSIGTALREQEGRDEVALMPSRAASGSRGCPSVLDAVVARPVVVGAVAASSPLASLCFCSYETRSRSVKPSCAVTKLTDATGRRPECS